MQSFTGSLASTTAGQTGNSTDSDTWVDKYGDLLFGFAFSRLRDKTKAEDAVQETFLAALKGKNNFQGQTEEKNWLFGILKNKIYDHFRKAARETSFADIEFYENGEFESFRDGGVGVGGWIQDHAPQNWGDVGGTIDREEFWKIYNSCCRKLPGKTGIAFNLREVDGLSTREICVMLQISESNLWVMLHRARMALRRCLELNWFQEP
jgi:RNA polymerase sigma-70 factor (TIGR02943 family)